MWYIFVAMIAWCRTGLKRYGRLLAAGVIAVIEVHAIDAVPSTARSCSGSRRSQCRSCLAVKTHINATIILITLEVGHGWVHAECDRVSTGVVVALVLEHQFCSCWNVLAHALELLLFKLPP